MSRLADQLRAAFYDAEGWNPTAPTGGEIAWAKGFEAIAAKAEELLGGVIVGRGIYDFKQLAVLGDDGEGDILFVDDQKRERALVRFDGRELEVFVREVRCAEHAASVKAKKPDLK